MNTVTTNIVKQIPKFGSIVFIEGNYYILTSFYIEDRRYAALFSLDTGNTWYEPEEIGINLASQLERMTKEYVVYNDVTIDLKL